MEMLCGRTADEVWRLAHALIGTRNGGSLQPSRSGDTREVLHTVLEIEEPRERWVLSRRPVMNPAFAVAETLWILAGSNDAGVLNYWFPRLPEFAGKGPTYDGAYGHRLRKHFGLDQIKRAYDILRTNPGSRQVVLQLWDAGTDMPKANGTPQGPDIPCNVVSLLKVRDGRLEWTQIMRSNDLFRGLPYNIFQFTLLQEILAGWLGIEVGGYYHWSDSLHAYVEDMARFSLTAPASLPPNADSLAIDCTRGEAVIKELFTRMQDLTKPALKEVEIAEIDTVTDAPAGYQNLLHLLSAESARRSGHHEYAEGLMQRCTNPPITQMWMAWRSRVGASRSSGSPSGLGQRS